MPLGIIAARSEVAPKWTKRRTAKPLIECAGDTIHKQGALSENTDVYRE